MSPQTKYRISKIIVAATVPLMCYAFSQMIPAGLSGDTPEVKKWFAVSMITVIIGIVAYMYATYYGAKKSDSDESNSMNVLNVAAKQIARPKQAARQKTVAPPSKFKR
jgi:hypothetical protein